MDRGMRNEGKRERQSALQRHNSEEHFKNFKYSVGHIFDY